MKIISNKYVVIVFALLLSACGGGGGSESGSVNSSTSSSASNEAETNDENANEPSAQQSFKAMTGQLFNASEDSEPLDISNMEMNKDADDDESAFSEMISENTQ